MLSYALIYLPSMTCYPILCTHQCCTCLSHTKTKLSKVVNGTTSVTMSLRKYKGFYDLILQESMAKRVAEAKLSAVDSSISAVDSKPAVASSIVSTRQKNLLELSSSISRGINLNSSIRTEGILVNTGLPSNTQSYARDTPADNQNFVDVKANDEKSDLKSISTLTISGINLKLSLLEKPLEPGPEDCCMSGCVRCVWTIFDEEYQEFKAEKEKLEKALSHLKAGKVPSDSE